MLLVATGHWLRVGQENWGGETNQAPALSDLDGDGDIEVIVVDEDHIIYVFDLESEYNESNIDWPMYAYNPQHTNCYIREYPSVTTCLEGTTWSEEEQACIGTSVACLEGEIFDDEVQECVVIDPICSDENTTCNEGGTNGTIEISICPNICECYENGTIISCEENSKK